MAFREVWTDEKVEQLRTLWATPLKVHEIAKRMRMSLNSVTGKADRLDLPPRRKTKSVPQKPKPGAARAPASTLPPLPSLKTPISRPPTG
jgi:GcrA cell cycle regulator